MEVDVCWKNFFQDDARYADVINGVGCAGQKLVTAEDLQEVDSQTIFGRLYEGLGKGRRIYVRDMARRVAFGVNFAIVGIENQELVDYAMPLRCMVYDAGEYEKQAGRIRRKLRKQKGLSAGEYLYGFGKDSCLYPAITFVLYGGKEKWDGPKTLGEMLDLTGLPEALRKFVSDYQIHIIEIRNLENTDVFQTDVKQVFDFIRCSGDKDALLRLVQGDESFQCMEGDAYEVATKYVKADELIQIKDEYKGKDGKINMCQALKELIEDGRMEGHSTAIRGIVVKMVRMGKSDEEIIELTECSAELIGEARANKIKS